MQKIILLFMLALAILAGCSDRVPGDESPAALPTAEAIPTSPSPPSVDTLPAPIDTAAQTEQVDTTPAQTEPDSGEAEALALDCTSPVMPTPALTEGPYYTTGSPEKTSLLEPDMSGTRLVITGYVLNTECEPIPDAWLDFWQADDQGQYDNAGFRLRAHQFTDDNGRYQLETIAPGIYPGRTAHIHVKVQAPDGPVLTSQLFLPDVPENQVDRIFSPQLVMEVEDTQDGKLATFNFILDSP